MSGAYNGSHKERSARHALATFYGSPVLAPRLEREHLYRALAMVGFDYNPAGWWYRPSRDLLLLVWPHQDPENDYWYQFDSKSKG